MLGAESVKGNRRFLTKRTRPMPEHWCWSRSSHYYQDQSRPTAAQRPGRAQCLIGGFSAPVSQKSNQRTRRFEHQVPH
jgi:hypothetical protein